MSEPQLSADQLRELLDYNLDSGTFTWLQKPSPKAYSAIAGKIAGNVDKRGYWVIKLFRKTHKAHRLAWLHHYGKWPELQIDHIDGNRANNSIANLRDVPHHVNNENQRKPQPRTRVGVLGVSIQRGKFMAQIQTKGKSKNLGRFDTAEEAHAAYLAAKRKLHIGCMI